MQGTESKFLRLLVTALLGGVCSALLVVFLIRHDRAAPPVAAVFVTNVITATNTVEIVQASKFKAAATEVPDTVPGVKTKGGGVAPAEGDAATKGSQVALNTFLKPLPVAPPRPLPPYHQVHVLSIGVNLNPGLGNLNYAVNDAVEVAALFKERFDFRNVVLLTNQQATRARITQEMENIRGRLSPGTNDDIIFFFSGHGMTKVSTEVSQGRTNDHRHGFLVPYDESLKGDSSLDEFRAYALEMKWVVEQMVGVRARHRLIFLDSCFSGFAFAEQPAARKVGDDFFQDMIRPPTVQIMTAGLDSEESIEHPNLRHGAFTHVLLKELREPGIRTMEEVFLPLRADLRETLTTLKTTNTMTPQHRYLKYQEGTFVFVPTDRIEKWANAKPTSQDYQLARGKGYFKPVDASDLVAVTNAPKSGAQADPEWKEKLERYEYRAALGDPYAQAALARMYRDGLGTKPDAQRAKLWAKEGQESFADVLGVKDPVAAAFLNIAMVQAMSGNRDAANAVGTIMLISALSKAFTSDPGKGMEDRRRNILRALDNPKPKEATKEAMRLLTEYENELGNVIKDLSAEARPASLTDIRAAIGTARESMNLGLQPPAREQLKIAGDLITQLTKDLKENQDKQKKPN